MIVTSPPPRRRAPPPVVAAMPEHTILACDLSLTSTGYAVYSRSGIITGRLKSKHVGVARLTDLRNQLAGLAEEVWPTHWAVEGYSFGSQARHHAIGEWGGLAKWTLENLFPGRGYIVSPNSIKKFATGNHAAKKTEIVLSLHKRWGLDIHQEDEADAAALAVLMSAYLHGPEVSVELTLFQKEALGWVQTKGKKKTVPVELVG